MRKLTTRELEVLDMIGGRLTVKEMAARQNVSLSAVNKRIGTLKSLYGVNTQRELFARFTEQSDMGQPATGLTESAWTKNHLPPDPVVTETLPQDELASMSVLHDSLAFQHEAPWELSDEVKVVPGLLDGRYAVSVRLVAVLAATLLILATIMVGLGVAQGLTTALNGISTEARHSKP